MTLGSRIACGAHALHVLQWAPVLLGPAFVKHFGASVGCLVAAFLQLGTALFSASRAQQVEPRWAAAGGIAWANAADWLLLAVIGSARETTGVSDAAAVDFRRRCGPESHVILAFWALICLILDVHFAPAAARLEPGRFPQAWERRVLTTLWAAVLSASAASQELGRRLSAERTCAEILLCHVCPALLVLTTARRASTASLSGFFLKRVDPSRASAEVQLMQAA
eukprot:TRINITY_DN16024_c0_g1_i1.p1 TRINITY_DN16024_c0_g1~~TRINITY_DN16024_c0_g1_i1.p1  ORF type:complete len:224 (+),score=43.10 TRINITY_DN16024_c0_g1_i1:45-716(+)